MLQWFNLRGMASSQERVAVARTGDDQRLDQELHCFLYEDVADAAVVEDKSAESGHSSDVGGAR